MDVILILALGTFAIVVAFLIWNKMSVKRHQQTGGKADGIGGPNDPMAGATANIRGADELQSSLDAPTGLDARKETRGS